MRISVNRLRQIIKEELDAYLAEAKPNDTSEEALLAMDWYLVSDEGYEPIPVDSMDDLAAARARAKEEGGMLRSAPKGKDIATMGSMATNVEKDQARRAKSDAARKESPRNQQVDAWATAAKAGDKKALDNLMGFYFKTDADGVNEMHKIIMQKLHRGGTPKRAAMSGRYRRTADAGARWALVQDVAQEIGVSFLNSVIPAYDPAAGPFERLMHMSIENKMFDLIMREGGRAGSVGNRLAQAVAFSAAAGSDEEGKEETAGEVAGRLVQAARDVLDAETFSILPQGMPNPLIAAMKRQDQGTFLKVVKALRDTRVLDVKDIKILMYNMMPETAGVERMNQQQIAAEVGMSQSTINDRIKKIERKLTDAYQNYISAADERAFLKLSKSRARRKAADAKRIAENA